MTYVITNADLSPLVTYVVTNTDLSPLVTCVVTYTDLSPLVTYVITNTDPSPLQVLYGANYMYIVHRFNIVIYNHSYQHSVELLV